MRHIHEPDYANTVRLVLLTGFVLWLVMLSNNTKLIDLSATLGEDINSVRVSKGVLLILNGEDIGKKGGGGFMFDTEGGLPALVLALQEREPFKKGESLIEISHGTDKVGYFRANSPITEIKYEGNKVILLGKSEKILMIVSNEYIVDYINN